MMNNYSYPMLQPKTGKCVAAIIIGALSLLLCGNLLLGIPAIVLAAMGLSSGKSAQNSMAYNQPELAAQQAATCNKYGSIALALGLVGIILGLLSIVLSVFLFRSYLEPYLGDIFDQLPIEIR